MSSDYLKIIIYVPEESHESMLKLLGSLGYGKKGDYEFWSFSTKGEERFCPIQNATPSKGDIGKLQKTRSVKIETICPKELWEKTRSFVLAEHPYEEPAYEVTKLEIS